MPSSTKSRSSATAVLVTLVLMAAVVYLVFFRGGTGGKPAAAQTPAPQAVTKVVAEPVEEAPREVKAVEIATPAVQEPSPLKAFRDHHEAGRRHEARAELAKFFAGELDDRDRDELASKGTEINQKLFAAMDAREVESYEIQTGDNLTKIASRYKQLKGCYGPILLLNDIRDPNATLRLGRKLKVTKGDWSIVVDKSLFRLFLCYAGAPVKTYAVAIGTDAKTPAGAFKVGNKMPKPAWYPPQELMAEMQKGGVPIPVPYGHAKNPLGEYWIALDHEQHSGLGIHGTNDPKSLGSKASNGCVRMDNVEVMMIAWTAWPGMAVTIVE